MKRRIGERGQATIEYLYVIPLLLLLLLSSLQFVFIYEAKQTLNYATFVGTRAGALNNGAMLAIQDGLASGLTPLFTHAEKTQQALKDARHIAKAELGDPALTRIEILNPTAAALGAFGPAEIPNDNLMYRPTDPEDGMNVQDANLLKVRVTYCVRLVVPLVNRMIYSFVVAPPAVKARIDSDAYTGGKIAAADLLKVETPGAASGSCSNISGDAYPYRIPVSSEAVVRMQSPFQHPGKWIGP